MVCDWLYVTNKFRILTRRSFFFLTQLQSNKRNHTTKSHKASSTYHTTQSVVWCVPGRRVIGDTRQLFFSVIL